MSAVLKPEPLPIVACTISRDVQIFDLLIEDMEAVLGERWGDLLFDDAIAYLEQPEARDLDFVAIAIDGSDELHLDLIIDVIAAAKSRGIKVILIAGDVSPAALHQLLREGGDEFVPYPLPEGELARAIKRVGEAPVNQHQVPSVHVKSGTDGDRSGVIIPVYGMAGGTGCTTLAVNLAWELALQDPKGTPPKVALIDLSLQSGSVATYLDLPRREAVLELLSDTESLDGDTLQQAMLTYGDKLHVLTSPLDLVPLDLVTPADVQKVLQVAAAHFDYVVIDMPPTIAEWGETVLNAAHICFATIELDMRSAQNTLRLKRAITAEGLPFNKYRFVLNRAPGFTDLSGKSRVKRLADSLGISIEVQLPDGGKAVSQAADQGMPIADSAAKNSLRREIAKLAKSVHAVNSIEEAAGKKARA